MERRAFMTGGEGGIGRTIAEVLRRDGLEVVAPTQKELELADDASFGAWLAAHATERFDVLVNCAGENWPAPLDTLPLPHWERTLRVNLTAAYRLVQAFAPGMAARGWGRIVNISSIYASLARPGRAPYSASKAGVEALTRTAALEYGAHGVLVNAVAPGFVDTPLTRQNNPPEKIRELCGGVAVGRLAQPQEIAELVAFLCSEKNSYMTGQVLTIDGGYSIQ